MGIIVVTTKIYRQAQEKLAEYQAYASPKTGLAHFSSSVGIDLSCYAETEAIPYQKTNSIASVNQCFKAQNISINNLKQQHMLGGPYPLFVGSGATVAKQLISYLDYTVFTVLI